MKDKVHTPHVLREGGSNELKICAEKKCLSPVVLHIGKSPYALHVTTLRKETKIIKKKLKKNQKGNKGLPTDLPNILYKMLAFHLS